MRQTVFEVIESLRRTEGGTCVHPDKRHRPLMATCAECLEGALERMYQAGVDAGRKTQQLEM